MGRERDRSLGNAAENIVGRGESEVLFEALVDNGNDVGDIFVSTRYRRKT